MPCAWPVTEDMKNPPHYPLTDVARYQGDGVAVVVAESRAQAKDAAELVKIDWEPLDAIVDVAKALDDGASLAHPDLGTNECYVWRLDTDATGEKLEDADVVVTRRYYQPRLIPTAIEPRAVLAEFGTVLPNDVEICIVDSTADTRYMVLPLRPRHTEQLSEAALAALVTRDSMIGVAVLPESRP